MISPELLLGAIGGFFSSLLGSLFGMGGGFVILAFLITILPISIVIPVQAAILVFVDATRAFAFQRWTQPCIVVPFLAGSVIGTIVGALIFVSLSEKVIGTGLACVLVLVTWFPDLRLRPHNYRIFSAIGVVHSLLATLFGMGGLLQATILHTQLKKEQITGTLACCFFIMEIFKVTSYGMAGFDYRPYLQMIIAIFLAAIPGALLGRKIGLYISETNYRRVYRGIVSLVVVKIIHKVWF